MARAIPNWVASGAILAPKRRIEAITALASALQSPGEEQQLPKWVQGDRSQGYPTTFCWEDAPLDIFEDDGDTLIRTLRGASSVDFK